MSQQSTLMSQRAVARWYDGPYPAPTVANHLTGDLRFQLEDVEAQAIEQAENRLLLLVGTLCVRHGQTDLWRSIDAAVHGNPKLTVQDALAELEQLTARRDEL